MKMQELKKFTVALLCITEIHLYALADDLRFPSDFRTGNLPHIRHIKPKMNQTVVKGSSVTFQCSVVIDLYPYVVWLKWKEGNSSKITESERNETLEKFGEFYQQHWLLNPHWNCTYAASVVFKAREDVPFTCLFSKTRYEEEDKYSLSVKDLQIKDAQFNDSGHFTCMATNTFGVSHEHAYLNVIPVSESTITMYNSSEEVTSLQKAKSDTKQIGAIVVSVVLFFVIVSFIALKMFCQLTKRCYQRNLHRVHHNMISNGHYSSDPSSNLITSMHRYLSSSWTTTDSEFEFPRERLILSGSILGEGAFGQVVLGVASGLNSSNSCEASGRNTSCEQHTVAVKMLKVNSTDHERNALLSEISMMKNIGKHENIINMLGCCTQDGPLFVLVEYAQNGNLREFLRSRRPPDTSQQVALLADFPNLTNRDIITMAYQVAKGMEFLCSKKCIHRDLAARNVLVTEDLVMKIADFGLARDIHYADYYKKATNAPLPVKWMAPEALFDRFFTTKSDVWSYGVLLWEIMTLGGTPYPSVPVESIFEHLKKGKRMEKPHHCLLEVYEIMKETWQTNPASRPNFTKLMESFTQITEMPKNQDYLDMNALGDHPLTTFHDRKVFYNQLRT